MHSCAAWSAGCLCLVCWGVSACSAGYLCPICWMSLPDRPGVSAWFAGCLCLICWVSLPDRPGVSAWFAGCLCLICWVSLPDLLGVSAWSAGYLCLICWVSLPDRPRVSAWSAGCLCLICWVSLPDLLGVSAWSAGCLCLICWVSLPDLLGISAWSAGCLCLIGHVSLPDLLGVSAWSAGYLCLICWVSLPDLLGVSAWSAGCLCLICWVPAWSAGCVWFRWPKECPTRSTTALTACPARRTSTKHSRRYRTPTKRCTKGTWVWRVPRIAFVIQLGSVAPTIVESHLYFCLVWHKTSAYIVVLAWELKSLKDPSTWAIINLWCPWFQYEVLMKILLLFLACFLPFLPYASLLPFPPSPPLPSLPPSPLPPSIPPFIAPSLPFFLPSFPPSLPSFLPPSSLLFLHSFLPSLSPALLPSLLSCIRLFDQFPPSTEAYQVMQDQLSMDSAALNAAASDMVTASRGSTNQLATSSKKFSTSYQDLLDSGMKLAGQTPVRSQTPSPLHFLVQSALSKADTLGNKATVRFRGVSALERVQLQTDKWNSAGTKFSVRLREVSALESVRLGRVDCYSCLLRNVDGCRSIDRLTSHATFMDPTLFFLGRGNEG